MNGKGEFPKQNETEAEIKTETPDVQSFKKTETHESATNLQTSLNLKTDSNKTIERIVIFYSDGSFKNYQN